MSTVKRLSIGFSSIVTFEIIIEKFCSAYNQIPSKCRNAFTAAATKVTGLNEVVGAGPLVGGGGEDGWLVLVGAEVGYCVEGGGDDGGGGGGEEGWLVLVGAEVGYCVEDGGGG